LSSGCVHGVTKYTVLCNEEEEGGYSGQCLELPSAISQGETLDELKGNMADAIQLVLASIDAEAEEMKKNGHRSSSINPRV
jgi:predicted RNase H-like HicB family nuclease